MEYKVIKVSCKEELKELLMAELAEVGFDSFLEDETGFEASVKSENFDEKATNQALQLYGQSEGFGFEITDAAKQNWNVLWESNYPMVEINEKCLVRAPFHQPEKNYEYELIVTPNMSFGTGHHATTSLMIKALLETACEGKQVLDAGSGTGILAILAMKKGATSADACDIEEWAVENAKENAEANLTTITVKLGTTEACFSGNHYEVILANINKNVLLEEIPLYASMITYGGTLLLSGFYEKDQGDLKEISQQHGLTFVGSSVESNWCCMQFKK